jgi:hypothetical protein
MDSFEIYVPSGMHSPEYRGFVALYTEKGCWHAKATVSVPADGKAPAWSDQHMHRLMREITLDIVLNGPGKSKAEAKVGRALLLALPRQG